MSGYAAASNKKRIFPLCNVYNDGWNEMVSILEQNDPKIVICQPG